MAKQLKTPGIEKCIGCGSCMLACARLRFKSLSLQRSAIRVRTAGGFRGPVIVDVCQGCVEPACAAVCPASALQPRAGGGVVAKPDRCIGCLRCVEACTVHGIHFDEELGYPVVCIHCGLCVEFCPHECLSLEESDVKVS